MGAALVIGAVVALIAVSWVSHTIINNVFDKGENALKRRRQDSETERIRQQIRAQRRDISQ
jgi:peptidoglycan/LPS O-acetylase OafA/YrhL